MLYRLIALLWLGCSWAHPAMTAPQRVVSLNLCTDDLLLSLLPREQIASISFLSADPSMSRWATQIDDMHLNHSHAEEIVSLQPDLILAGQFSDVATVKLLRQLGYTVEIMPLADSWEEARQEWLRLGTLLGQHERAEQVVAQIDQALTPHPARQQAAMTFGPNGYTNGLGTLQHQLLSLAGYRNLPAERGLTGYRAINIEQLLSWQPRLLVVDEWASRTDSLAHRALNHPALDLQAQKLVVPWRWWSCPGPGLIDAMQRLQEGV